MEDKELKKNKKGRALCSPLGFLEWLQFGASDAKDDMSLIPDIAQEGVSCSATPKTA